MDDNLTTFLIMAVAITAAVALIIMTHWIRAREKRRLAGSATEIIQLSVENDRLQDEVSAMKSRLAVLETIATDPAERTAREIEQLRNNP